MSLKRSTLLLGRSAMTTQAPAFEVSIQERVVEQYFRATKAYLKADFTPIIAAKS
jgi:hypothetical protein